MDRLCNELPNLVERYLVPFEQFNHLDFIYAIDAIDMVYNEVSILMQKYLWIWIVSEYVLYFSLFQWHNKFPTIIKNIICKMRS